MRNRLALIACLIVFSAFQSQPDPFEKLREAMEKYVHTQRFSFNYRMEWDCDKREGDRSHMNGTFVRDGNSFALIQGSNRTVHTGGYLLNINERDKVIIVQRASGEVIFDELFKVLNMDRAHVEGEYRSDSQGDVLVFKSLPNTPLSYVSSSRIRLNEKGWITAITTDYNPDYQDPSNERCRSLSIRYAAYQFENLDTRALALSTYVKISGKEVSASPAYTNYEIVSSLNYETE